MLLRAPLLLSLLLLGAAIAPSATASGAIDRVAFEDSQGAGSTFAAPSRDPLSLDVPIESDEVISTIASESSSFARVAHERRVSVGTGRAWEPSVAANPTDPDRIAVIYQHRSGSFHPVVRISHDGGKTWKTAAGSPGGSGGTDQHSTIAYGPGPKAGSARLYYVNMHVSGGGHRVSTSYSDNEGKSWSKLRVETRTPPWVGGFPDITVDRDPDSPNYGVVYVAYNWLASATKGPGLHILASADYGRTWRQTEIAVAKPPKGYGDTWRIDYRVRTARDGSAYVAFWQADLRVWRTSCIFCKGGTGNTGRIGFSVARFVFDRAHGTFAKSPTVMAARLSESSFNMGAVPSGTSGGVYTDPAWSIGLDVDHETGDVFLAVGADSGIRVYRSSDKGRTWAYRTIPKAPSIGGRAQLVWKPNLVVGKGFVMVTMHTLDKTGGAKKVGNAYAISFDGGKTFSRPKLVNGTRWRAANLAKDSNGPGLRERADLTAGNDVFFVYGDGRLGRGAVYGALIKVTIVPPPTPPAP